MQGKVKFYNKEKSFGFIISEDKEEIFFHMSGLSAKYKNPSQNDVVEYSVTEGKKGVNAVDVEKV